MSAFKETVDRVVATVGTITFNGYTIAMFIKEHAFPILLAIGSLVLTIVMICVQLRKNKLIKLEMRMQEELYRKTCLESEILKHKLENNKDNDI